MELLHSHELSIIKLLQQFRNPALDSFFQFLNFFDRGEFFFVLIPIIWMVYSWKMGLKLFYIILLNAAVNFALKGIFQEPRPYHIDSSLGLIAVPGFGFPSGAAQTTILLSGILIHAWKNKWAWFVAANYIFWVSLSRIYLGVHFPSDILGGYMVGAGLFLAYLYGMPRAEKYLNGLSRPILLVYSLVLPLSLLLLSTPFFLTIVFAAMGVGLGTFISAQRNLFPEPASNWKDGLIGGAIGVLGTFFVAELFAQIPLDNQTFKLMIKLFTVGCWASLGASVVYRKIWAEDPRPSPKEHL